MGDVLLIAFILLTPVVTIATLARVLAAAARRVERITDEA